MNARELITEHLDLWTGAVTRKSGTGRGSSGKIELTGVRKLRELIFELASKGALISTTNDSSRILKLQEFAELVMGQAPPGSECNKNGIGEIFVKTGEFGAVYPEVKEWTTKPLRMARKGDVLICVVGATVGKLNMAIDCAIGRSVAAIRPDKTVISEYLYYCLIPFTLKIRSQSKGSAQGVIGKAVLNNVELRVPPLDEQKLIVRKVDELMTLCDRLEHQTSDQLEAHETLVDTLLGTLTQSENATELADNWARLAAHFDTLFTTEQSIDKLKQTILQLAVMGRLVEQSPNDTPAPELLKAIQEEKDRLFESKRIKKFKELPPVSAAEEPYKIPRGWMWSRIGSIALYTEYGTSAKTLDSIHGIPVVKMGDIQEGKILIGGQKHAPKTTEGIHALLLHQGDLLYNRTNSPELVGKTGIFRGPDDTLSFASYLIRIRVEESLLSANFLNLTMNSPLFRETEINPHLKQQCGQANVNGTILKQMRVPLPPREEQTRIVQKVDELMALCDQLKERLNHASETRCQLAGAVVQGALN